MLPYHPARKLAGAGIDIHSYFSDVWLTHTFFQQTLLNLAEFMQQDEHPLPVEIQVLGRLAESCHAYAKALHYKEQEFRYVHIPLALMREHNMHTLARTCAPNLAVSSHISLRSNCQPGVTSTTVVSGIIESLISINNQVLRGFTPTLTVSIFLLISIRSFQLQQPEAAWGILAYAQKLYHIELKESWYEKLRKWDVALEAYDRKQGEVRERR